MHRADADHTAAVFQAQPLGDVEGIIITIPHIDILFGEFFSNLARGQIFQFVAGRTL
jgi:hypothetical protein